jgi:hypothetical protein
VARALNPEVVEGGPGADGVIGAVRELSAGDAMQAVIYGVAGRFIACVQLDEGE